jgi:hypothetical protein
MAIEELKSIFRPVVIRRGKDADSSRRGRKHPPPPEEKEEAPDPEKGKVDIRV